MSLGSLLPLSPVYSEQSVMTLQIALSCPNQIPFHDPFLTVETLLKQG